MKFSLTGFTKTLLNGSFYELKLQGKMYFDRLTMKNYKIQLKRNLFNLEFTSKLYKNSKPNVFQLSYTDTIVMNGA